MSNEKGGLIKKKKKPVMQAPAPVKKTQASDFSYSTMAIEQEPTQPIVQQPVKQTVEQVPQPPKKTQLIIGKQNSTKSLKVPSVVHTEINLLGSFMDENKTYVILQKLIDSYVKNELTNRQQRQFEFMLETLLDEK